MLGNIDKTLHNLWYMRHFRHSAMEHNVHYLRDVNNVNRTMNIKLGRMCASSI